MAKTSGLQYGLLRNNLTSGNRYLRIINNVSHYFNNQGTRVS